MSGSLPPPATHLPVEFEPLSNIDEVGGGEHGGFVPPRPQNALRKRTRGPLRLTGGRPMLDSDGWNRGPKTNHSVRPIFRVLCRCEDSSRLSRLIGLTLPLVPATWITLSRCRGSTRSRIWQEKTTEGCTPGSPAGQVQSAMRNAKCEMRNVKCEM